MDTKFVVDQKPFMAILSSMQAICTKRTALDATSYILMHVGHKELVIKSTDLEISLQASYLFETSTVTVPYAFMVSGKRLFDLVKELEGMITCHVVNQQLMLEAGPINLALHIKDAQDFPPFPERIENLMQVEGEFFLDLIAKVAFLIPQNNANAALNGLYAEISSEHMRLTTTDGHCLAQVRTTKYTLAEPRKWLLPRRAVFELKKILESNAAQPIFIGLCGNQLVFSGESFNFFTKLLADPFPQYEAILSKQGFKPARVDKSNFVKTLRRSACLLSGQFIATQFGFTAAELNVCMNNKDVGQLVERIPLMSFDGEALDIRFYAPYVLSGLQAFSEDTLTFYLGGASRPIMFESVAPDKEIMYLVMPVSPTAA